MRPRLAYGIAAILLIAGASLALAAIHSAHGPIPHLTGARAIASKPEEFNCTLCHWNEWDNFNTPGGRVEILNVPVVYTPGQSYAVTVRLRSDSTLYSATRKWGFELTAVRQSDGEGAGTFLLPNADTLQIVPGEADFASRRYVEHTFLGTRDGLGGPVQWTFSWRAPSTAQGLIYFFCAGNAADGTDDPGNDFIFTASDSTFPPGALEAPASFQPATALAPPRPNPARGPVGFDYSLAAGSRIELSVFDLHGRRVRGLASGWRAAGPGRATWDGRSETGAMARAGTYFARLTVAGEGMTLTRKVSIER